MIRTRLQGDTPFFPNMLNNGKVEVCLKEDVDKALAEKDEEIAALKHAINMADAEYFKLKRCRDECERQFQEKVEEIAILLGELNACKKVFGGWRSYKDDPPKENDAEGFIFCGHQRYAFQPEAETEYFVDVGHLDIDGTLCMFNDWHEGQEIFEIDYWFPLPKHPQEKE